MIKNYGLRKAEFCIIFVENVINVMWDVRIYRHRRTWQCGILPFATNSPPNKMVDKTNENKQLYIKIIERKHHRISSLAANLVHFCIAKLNWIVILMRALASMWFAFEFIFPLLEIKCGCIQIWEIIYRSQWIKLNSTKRKIARKRSIWSTHHLSIFSNLLKNGENLFDFPIHKYIFNCLCKLCFEKKELNRPKRF